MKYNKEQVNPHFKNGRPVPKPQRREVASGVIHEVKKVQVSKN